MKILLAHAVIAASLFAAIPASAQSPADKVCLRLDDITASKPSSDGSSILFQMRDGKMWRNDLQSKCPDLRYNNGFSWIIRGSDRNICENQETFRVTQSDQVCQLGKFSQVSPAPKN